MAGYDNFRHNVEHAYAPPSVQVPQVYEPPINNAASYDLSIPELDAIKTPDELWIHSWLHTVNRNTNPISLNPPKKKITKSSTGSAGLGIHVAKKYLLHCLAILHKLNSAQEYLQQNVETMSSSEWKKKTIEIGTLKDEFIQIVSKFENNNALTTLRIAIEKRRKKRKQQKQRKLFRKEQYCAKLENLTRAHKETDAWLESMKDQVDRVKMEEHFKKDADCILSEVTKKRSDARKQLSLIQALVKLRQVREQAAIQRGEKILLEDSRAFGKVTSKLIKMWEDVLNIYLKEEQGLRLMLEQNAVEDTKAAKVAKENRIVKEWHNVFFDNKQVSPSDSHMYWALTAAERDTETFIAIRKSWDTFFVPHDYKSGSNIPVGWVLPDGSSEEWKKFLQNKPSAT